MSKPNWFAVAEEHAAELLREALNDYRKFGMPSCAAETARMLRETEED